MPLLVMAVVICTLILLPIVTMLLRSIQRDRLGSGLTFEHFQAVVQEPLFLTALRNTLVSAVAAALVATFLGVILAWLVARTDMPGRRVFHALNMVPFFLSPFVGALAWSILASPRSGIINSFARDTFGIESSLVNIHSLPGLVWVLALFYTPYVYLFCYAPLRQMDPALEDASRASGASWLQTTRRVTVPLILPAIISGFLIAFVTSAEIFDVPILLTAPANIPTLSTVIYQSVQYPPDYNRASAISTVLVTITLLGVWAQRRYISKRDFTTVTGKGYRPDRIQLRKWRWVAFMFEAGFIITAVALPLFGLFQVSISKLWFGSYRHDMFTWQHYVYVIRDYSLTQRATTNSLILGVTGATIGVILALLVAYTIYRTKVRWRGALDAITVIPIGVPGIVLALGTLIVWIGTPLYGTLGILLLAYLTRFLPYAQRSVSGAILSLSPELENSARTSGASWFMTMKSIVIPLLRSGLATGWILLFVIFIRELSTSVLLYRPGTETMAVALLILSERNLGDTAAFAVLQTILLFAAVLIVSRVSRTEDVKI